MAKSKCTQYPWFVDVSHVKNHACISSLAHGAIAQVLVKMDSDWSTNEAVRARKEAELAANLRVIQLAPEMAEFINVLYTKTDWATSLGELEDQLSLIYHKLHKVEEDASL